MTREWKRGDLAIICVPASTAPGYEPTETGYAEVVAIPAGGGGWFSVVDPTYYWEAGYSFHKTDPRPLVVIDPEDGEQVERLMSAYFAVGKVEFAEWSLTPRALRMRSALRSLIADPKPDEPTGLGAVVEDVHGHRWIYAPSGLYLDHWQGVDDRRDWSNINAVKVLSEGVTA